MADVEKRAFRMAVIATGQHQEAMDIVQDSMMKLVLNYGQRHEDQWPPLFHRILQSTIRDWYRRQKVRNQWRRLFGLKGSFTQSDKQQTEDEHNDVIQGAVNSFTQAASKEPMQNIANDRAIESLDKALHELPARQQQVFLLRVWEGLNIAETADAMGCSQGSVKTHYSRALHTLRDKLEEPGL